MLLGVQVSCVVVLGREKARSFPVFWPDPDHNVNFGPVFSVDRYSVDAGFFNYVSKYNIGYIKNRCARVEDGRFFLYL